MRRLFSFTVPLLLALALPALAQASTGTVLSVSQPKHQVQLVSTNRVVHAYGFSGQLNGVKQGTKLSFAAARSRITHVRAIGTSSKFSFLGKVVHSGKSAVVLSLGDSQQLSLATKPSSSHRSARAQHRAHCDSSSTPAAPTVTIEINGLQSGETVLVTESTASSGDVTITITVPPSGTSQFGPELTASGLVGKIGAASFSIVTADQSNLKFHMAPAALANTNLNPCDTVVVSYHLDDQMMIADKVVDNGPSGSGTCSGGSGSGSGSGSGAGGSGGSGGSGGAGGSGSAGSANANAIGTITAVSTTSITVNTSAGNGSAQTFTVENQSVTLGFIVGDSVDVTYEQVGTAFVAEQVEYDNTLTSGVVTALAAGGTGFDTITMTDDYTSQSETFYVPTALLAGQGTLIGDDISVSYYQATRGLTLDHLHDNGPAS